MNTAQRIAKNTLSLLLAGIIAQLLTFCTVVYLARVLGPTNFGKISFATAFIVYFTLITHLGLPLWGTREIARDRNKINLCFNHILVLRIGLAGLSFVLLLILVFILNKPKEIKQLLFLYGIGLFFSAITIDWIFQGIERMEFIGLSRILSNLIFLGCAILFVKSYKQLLLVPCFQIAGILLAALTLLAILVKHFGRPAFQFNGTFGLHILRKAIPLGISIILIQILYSIDTIMLGFMRSNAEIGFYNAAYKIILPLIMVGSIYFDAVFPVLSNYYENSLDALQKLQSYNTRLMTIGALPIAIGGTLLALPAINLIYGGRYNNGVAAFQILSWAVFFIYLNMIYARGMWACNKQNEYVKIVLGQALTNILLNFLLIPSYGIVGAAVSTVFAEFAGFFFYYREFNKVVYVPIHNQLYKPLLAGVSMFLFLTLLKSLNLSVQITGALLIYGSVLFLIKGITKTDIQHLINLFNLNMNKGLKS